MAAPIANKLRQNYCRCTHIIKKFVHNDANSQYHSIPLSPERRRKRNKIASRRYNWENLYLFGPSIISNKPVKSHRARISSHPEISRMEQLKRAEEAFFPKKNTPSLTHGLINEIVDTELIFNKFTENLKPTKYLPYPFTYVPETIESDDYLKAKVWELLHDATECNVQPECLPSVTTVLNKSMNEIEELQQNNRVLSSLGQFGNAFLYDQLRELHNVEKNIRHCLNLYFSPSKQDIRLPDNVVNYWNSMLPILSTFSEVKLNVKVIHPHLHYSGVIDCIAIWQKHVVLIEILLPYYLAPLTRKLNDAPLRATAYAGALNISSANEPQITEILLITPTTEKSPAHVHLIDLETAERVWLLWLNKLQKYWEIRCNKPEASYTNISCK